MAAATAAVDTGFPANTELTIDAEGVPHLKQQKASSQPNGLLAFEAEVHARMRERHLLDILKDSTCWTAFTRHFGSSDNAWRHPDGARHGQHERSLRRNKSARGHNIGRSAPASDNVRRERSVRYHVHPPFGSCHDMDARPRLRHNNPAFVFRTV
nr:hypothetical protein [Ensifer aridi]